MEVSQTAIGLLLLNSLLCGALLGVIYDVFRITRLWMGAGLPPAATAWSEKLELPQKLKYFSHPIKTKEKKPGQIGQSILICAEDLLFCLVAALLFILLLYEKNDGQFRLSALCFLLLGFFVYYKTIGRLVLMVSGTLTVLLKACIRWSLAILFYPFYRAGKLLWRLSLPVRQRVIQYSGKLKAKIKLKITEGCSNALKKIRSIRWLRKPTVTKEAGRVSNQAIVFTRGAGRG